MKICTKCKNEQDLSLFSKDKYSKTGYKPICKSCIKTYRKSRKKEDNITQKKYALSNPGKIKQYYCKRQAEGKVNKYYQKRRLDPKYRVKENIRNRIYKFLKGTKSKTTEQILGVKYKNYITYLESLFTSNMNWGNYGIFWEIDHIIPLSKGGSFHYTNTQPLNIKENRAKSNKT